MVVLRRDLDSFRKVSLAIATGPKRLEWLLEWIWVEEYRGDRQSGVDNLEADMGVLIITGSGQSIAAGV